MSLPVDDRLPGQRWAQGLMAGFVILFAGIAGLVAWERQHRSELELVRQPTAVGDPVTLRYDPKQNPAAEILKWHGQPYYLQSNAMLRIPDYDVTKLARDDSGRIQLYRANGNDENDGRLVLVKVDHDAFLRLTSR
ncbi:MAG: hypothetical protein JO015_05765 [Verrucomicrobia bacterium]|nr:hypothetical protein [Verrucomicrobiota bacterium]